jgi:hypothetical protein
VDWRAQYIAWPLFDWVFIIGCPLLAAAAVLAAARSAVRCKRELGASFIALPRAHYARLRGP